MESLSIAVQAYIPTVLWGSPGAGKTYYLYALHRAIDRHLETIIASIRDPSDFAGLPVLTQADAVRLATPEWARRVIDLAKEGKRSSLFFDEVSTAPPASQAGLLRVIHEGVVGDEALPVDDDGNPMVSMVAAANPPEEAAGGWELTPPMANRVVHLDWKLNPTAWVEGIVAGFPDPEIRVLPADWRSGIPQARALVASFIRSHPDQLHAVPKDEAKAGRAWPSPRTWDMVGTALAACEAYGATNEALSELVVGCVGEGAGGEFLTHMDNLDLADPEDLLADPAAFRLPGRGDQQFATLTSVVQAVIGNLTQPRWEAAWEILAAAAHQGAVDIAAGSCKRLVAARTAEMPLPIDQLQPFIPLLSEAGLLTD